MIEAKNLGEVFDQIDKWIDDAEAVTTRFCRGMSVSIFEQVLANSVQYSGDFAANWKYSLNNIDSSFKKDAVPEFRNPEFTVTWMHGTKDAKVPFWQMFTPMDDRGGDQLFYAVRYALRANRGRDNNFKLGDTIYISNNSEHDESYAAGIEEGSIKLRTADSKRPLGRAIDKVMGDAVGGAGRVSGEGVVDLAGYKSVTKRSQLDSLRRRPTGKLKG